MPGLLTHRDSEIIHLCCVKSLSFGVICYVAIDSEHSTIPASSFIDLLLIHSKTALEKGEKKDLGEPFNSRGKL